VKGKVKEKRKVNELHNLEVPTGFGKRKVNPRMHINNAKHAA